MSGIEMVGLNEALKDLDPVAFDKTVIHTTNEIVTQGFNTTKKGITQKFNIRIKTLSNPVTGQSKRGEYAFESKYTGKTNKRQGRISISKANKSKRYIEVGIYGAAPAAFLFSPGTLASQLNRSTSKGKVRLTKRIIKMSTNDKRAVKVKVMKDGKETRLKSAFIAKMKSGHVGIFQRTSAGIIERKVHAPSTMFELEIFREHIGNAMDRSFHKRFEKNWRYYHAK